MADATHKEHTKWRTITDLNGSGDSRFHLLLASGTSLKSSK